MLELLGVKTYVQEEAFSYLKKKHTLSQPFLFVQENHGRCLTAFGESMGTVSFGQLIPGHFHASLIGNVSADIVSSGTSWVCALGEDLQFSYLNMAGEASSAQTVALSHLLMEHLFLPLLIRLNDFVSS